MVKDDQWFGRFLAFTRTHDLVWAYWALGGTESNGTTRSFGFEGVQRAEFGLLNTNWEVECSECNRRWGAVGAVGCCSVSCRVLFLREWGLALKRRGRLNVE